MRSMTGYGHYLSKDEYYNIEIEIKSVNGRYLDMNISTDSVISHLDNFIRDKIISYVKRGRFTIRIYVTDKKEPNLELNTVYLRRLFDLHQQAKELLDSPEDITIQDLLQYDGVLIRKISKISDQSFIERLEAALEECLKKYDKMTREEGQKMKQWIKSSTERMQQDVEIIEKNLPNHRKEIKNKLTKSVEELISKPLGEDIERRLMAEISLYMDKNDVTEEVVRLKDHLRKITLFLNNDVEETGRKLNFIFQEMHREVQTIGAKFNSVQVFPSILQIKEEIEKCRELVQNVE